MVSDPLPEQDLIRRLRGRDPDAFALLVERYERRVFSLALRMLRGDYAEAEDAAQEIFLAVHQALPRFRGDARLDTWIHRIGMNVCLQRLRKPRLQVEVIQEDSAVAPDRDDPFHYASARELGRDLEAALQTLPDPQRAVVVLHALQGLTYPEVARALGCPEGTVKSRLSAAFRALRRQLAAYGGASGEANAKMAEVSR
jgi:RNA polymerase sigma-70 factor, ECF subfamily